MIFYKGNITKNNLPKNGVFVFGSNPVGINGAGAARVAREHFGVGSSERMNNTLSKSKKAYGIVTIKYPGLKQSVKLTEIYENVGKLYSFALKNPDLNFFIAYDYPENNPKSLNGYSRSQLVTAFAHPKIPENIKYCIFYG